MDVNLEIKLKNGVTLNVKAKVETCRDINKLGTQLQNRVIGVRRALPDILEIPVERLRFVSE